VRRRERNLSSENLLLKIIANSPRASLTQIGKEANMTKAKVQKIIARLREDKMLASHRNGKSKITDKGRKEIGIACREDDD
jgi:predicted transcriptional regulator